MALIDSTRVTEIFMNCLLKKNEVDNKNEPTVKTVFVEGITISVYFSKERIESNKKEIEDIVDNLEEVFYKGYSFLRMCLDKNNNQWTSTHKVQQELLLLALGVDKMRYCMPREDWDIFPHSIPYIISKFENEYLVPVFE